LAGEIADSIVISGRKEMVTREARGVKKDEIDEKRFVAVEVLSFKSPKMRLEAQDARTFCGI
jgi:hypothetical protein